MNAKYKEIVELPHPTFKRHPRMSNLARAAQFAPFAALSGHDAALSERERSTDVKKELDEQREHLLDIKLHFILLNISLMPYVRITYFMQDSKKQGGHYIKYEGRVKKWDEYRKELVMEDENRLSIATITDIESELFRELSLEE
ncbi:MAG: hypothetical protein KBS95_01505 [Alistipes sp.]|nr:hypothetical protein [Candidatus Alistipes equi]